MHKFGDVLDRDTRQNKGLLWAWGHVCDFEMAIRRCLKNKFIVYASLVKNDSKGNGDSAFSNLAWTLLIGN